MYFKGARKNLGVDVNVFTGEVMAAGHPDALKPMFPDFYFLMTASQVVELLSDRWNWSGTFPQGNTVVMTFGEMATATSHLQFISWPN